MTCVVMPITSSDQLLNRPTTLHPTNNQSISQSIKLLIPDSTTTSQRPSISAAQSNSQSNNQVFVPSNVQRCTIEEIEPINYAMMKRPSINQLTHAPLTQSVNSSNNLLISQPYHQPGNQVMSRAVPSSHRRSSLDNDPINQSNIPSNKQSINLSVDEEVVALKNDFGQIISLSTPNSRSLRSINQNANHSIHYSNDQAAGSPGIPSTPTFVQPVSLPAPSLIVNPHSKQSNNQTSSPVIRPLSRQSVAALVSSSANPSNGQSDNQNVDVAHPFTPGSPVQSPNQIIHPSINHSISQSLNRPRPVIQLRASMDTMPISFTAPVAQSQQTIKPVTQTNNVEPRSNQSTLSPTSANSQSGTQPNNQTINQSIFPIRSAMSPRQAVAFHAVTKEIKERSFNHSLNQSANRRTLTSSNSAAHLRPPFFSPSNQTINQSINQSINQATSKTTGPEGYLASLNDQAPVQPDPAVRQSNKRATFNPRKPSFFNSVKQILNRSSFESTDQSVNQPSTPNKPTIAYSAQVSLSPHHHNLSNQSFNQSINQSDEHLSNNLSTNQSALPSNNHSNNHRTSFSHPQAKSPSSEDHNHSTGQLLDPCVYTHGINRGIYGQTIQSNSKSNNQSSLAAITTARKLALANQALNPSNSQSPNQSPNQSRSPSSNRSNNQTTNQASNPFLESWSESDDPLSPSSFQQIIPGLFLGSAKSALNIDRLIDCRITHIVTIMNRPLNFLAQPGDAADADILSFNGQANNPTNVQSIKVPSAHPLFGQVMHALTFHFCYLLDIAEADLLSALDDCLPFIERAHAVEKGHVLIHCQAGISRSASVVIAYVAKVKQQSIKKAFECCSLARPYINPNEGFLTQLDLWHRTEIRKQRQQKWSWQRALERFAPWTNKTKRARAMIRQEGKSDGKWRFARPIPEEARIQKYLD